MLSIDPNKAKVLQFKMNISGNASAPVARLNIPLNEDLNLIIPGKIHDNSIHVSIPRLKPFYENLKAGAAQLEVIIDGSLFTPWIEQIEYKEQNKVVVESVSEQESTQADKTVKIGASLVTEQEVEKTTKTIGKYQFKDDNGYL